MHEIAQAIALDQEGTFIPHRTILVQHLCAKQIASSKETSSSCGAAVNVTPPWVLNSINACSIKLLLSQILCFALAAHPTEYCVSAQRKDGFLRHGCCVALESERCATIPFLDTIGLL